MTPAGRPARRPSRASAAAASVVAAAWACMAGPAAAQAGRYTLDPERSWVHFEVPHFGTSTLRGRIGPFAGTVALDPAAGRAEVGLAIETARVDTGVRPLDGWLRGADGFDSARHPEAFFVARQARFDAAGGLLALRGEFTLRGISQPLELRALRWSCRAGATPGGSICGGDFEAQLQRSDFGITFGLPFVADRVRLQIQVEGRRDLLSGTSGQP